MNRSRFLAIALATVCSVGSAHAVVVVETGIVTGVRLEGRVSAVSQQGPLTRGGGDTFPDSARAAADAAAGTLRVSALDGGASGFAAAGATATIIETITITGAPGRSGLATFSFLASAFMDTLSIETGERVGGVTRAFFDASAQLTAVLPRQRITNTVGIRHSSGHSFTARTPAVVERVDPIGPTLTTTEVQPSSAPSAPNPVTDLRIDVQANAISFVRALMEIDFRINPGDQFQLVATMRGQAAGDLGHGAFIDGENTGRLGLRLPGGFGFTSESGEFLSRVEPVTPSPVPGPAPLGLLVVGIGGLLLVRRRGTRAAA
jgi:hypothetical protein